MLTIAPVVATSTANDDSANSIAWYIRADVDEVGRGRWNTKGSAGGRVQVI
jgi:hypothetical protein